MTRCRFLLDSLSLPALAIASMLSVTAMTFAPPAHAQATVDKKQLASQYTESGLTAQAAGDYDTAISFYKQAYEQVPHPVLLFNMAQAHRLAGRPIKARALYERYLEIEPDGVKSRTARENLSIVDTQIAALGTEAERDEIATKPPVQDSPSPSKVPSDLGPETGQPKGGVGRGWLPYTLMTIGGLAIVGGVVGVVIDEDPRLDPTVKQPATIMDTGRLGAGLIAGGVVLAGLGGVMWWTAGDKPKKRPRVTAIIPTRSGALVGVGGTF